jgi:hypothetical protein
MKIEVELSEIETLRKENQRLYEDVKRIQEKYNSLDKENLYRKSMNLATEMANLAISRIFKELGFDCANEYNCIYLLHNYETHEDWFKKDKVKVNLGAKIVGQMRSAFVEIGVVPKEETEKENIEKHFE